MLANSQHLAAIAQNLRKEGLRNFRLLRAVVNGREVVATLILTTALGRSLFAVATLERHRLVKLDVDT